VAACERPPTLSPLPLHNALARALRAVAEAAELQLQKASAECLAWVAAQQQSKQLRTAGAARHGRRGSVFS
jgi:hypothetical protein